MKHSGLVRLAAAAVTVAGMFAALPAVAGGPGSPLCSDSFATTHSPGYQNDCQRFTSRMLTSNPGQDIQDLKDIFNVFASGNVAFSGTSKSPNNGPFTSDPEDLTMGTLQIDVPVSGFFALALQSKDKPDDFSFYLFNSAAFHGGPIILTFDTDGIANANGSTQPSTRLLFAALFTQPAGGPPGGGTVPEPAGAALVLGALGALALTTRHR